MKTISKRLCKLESRLGSGPATEPMVFVLSRVDRILALDSKRCIQILRESGFLPPGPFCTVNLCNIPESLNEEETERFLRENGTKICPPRGA